LIEVEGKWRGMPARGQPRNAMVLVRASSFNTAEKNEAHNAAL